MSTLLYLNGMTIFLLDLLEMLLNNIEFGIVE